MLSEAMACSGQQPPEVGFVSHLVPVLLVKADFIIPFSAVHVAMVFEIQLNTAVVEA